MYLERFKSIKKGYTDIISFGMVTRLLNLLKTFLLGYFLLESQNFLGKYNIAFSGTMLLTGFLMTGIHYGLIPVIQLSERESGMEGRMETTNKFVNAGFVISIPLMLIMLIFAPQIVTYISSDLTGQEVGELARLVRIGSPIVALHFIRMVGVGYLQSDHRFISGAKSGVANALVYLIYIILFRENMTPAGLMIAGLFAVAAQIYVLFKSLYGDGYRFKLDVDFQDKYVKKTLIFMLAIGLSVLIGDQLAKIDLLSAGAIGKIYPIGDITSPIREIQSLFIVALVTVIYPILSENYIEGNMEELRKNSKFGFYILLLVLLPIGLGLAVLSDPIINLKFINQGLAIEEMQTMSTIFKLGIVSMIASILYAYTTRFYYSLRDFKIPIILALVYLGLNYLFNSIFVVGLGSIGLLLSTVLSLLIIIIYTIYDYNKRIDFIDMEDFKNNMLVVVGSLATMLILMLLIKLAFNFLFEDSRSINLALVVIGSLGGALVYFLSMRESLRKINRKKQVSHKKK